MKSKFLLFVTGVMLCVPFTIVLGARLVRGLQFDAYCGGHLKRAGDANTVEMAADELKIAIKYLDDNNIKTGYTSILWQTPDEDVGFWYNNLSSSLAELQKVTPETSQLERTNILMKLRQTLLDHSKEGEKVTVPEGIGAFPHNTAFAIALGAFMVVGLIGLFLVLVSLS